MSLPFNLSYSTLNTYKKSPLEFYFKKWSRLKGTKINLPYAGAGNSVHNPLEQYIKTKSVWYYKELGISNFDVEWLKSQAGVIPGIPGTLLDESEYEEMFKKGVRIVDIYNLNKDIEKSFAELKIDKVIHGVRIIAYLDFVIKYKNGDITVIDWKTGSDSSYKVEKEQRLFYSWLIWYLKKTIPLCVWHYLKTPKDRKKRLKTECVQKDQFTEQEMVDYDLEMQRVFKEIEEKGDNISNYEPGNYKHPFNEYKDLCEAEKWKRLESDKIKITLKIKGSHVYFDGLVPPILLEGIDRENKFDLPNKYWMQDACRKKDEARRKFGGNYSEVGVVHMFNKRFNSFPIGLMKKVVDCIERYAEYYKKKVDVVVDDERNPQIMNNKTIINWPIETKFELRPYQRHARDLFIQQEMGIINIATGGGKTFIASEIIRIIKGRVLWIIDRKELLEQTKAELEKHLGVTVGVFQGDTMDLCQDITIATIQSLNAKVAKNTALRMYLNTVNFVIIDEFHKAAADSYKNVANYLPNTKYRLGLTATAFRDDGKTPILESILGNIIYRVTTQDLIEQGYLVKPTIKFIELPDLYSGKQEYPDDYSENIVFNQTRNNKIFDIVFKNPFKKILILTKIVDHGKELSEKLGCNFLHGKLGKAKRTEMFEKFKNDLDDPRPLIITQSIAAEGLDIPDLDIIINAAANKGDGKSIQVLGRVLRTFKNKVCALYYDFLDVGEHTRKHSRARILAFETEGHSVEVVK